MPLKEPVNQMALTKSLGRKMARALGRGREHGKDTEDRSLAQALHVLKEMKAAGRTWQEYGRTHGTGIRREPGEGSTESARPINTQFPAPATSGAGINPSRGAVHIAAGKPGRLQEGGTDALSRRAATE
jgi:hypothetical protein